ncbi:hypothetical protein F4818DRAFT_165529 [Hypoxylon cercidicola]|nr:hypothetical protein F4818DRAFT_165529 [Hypoxylon cercidicola]
MVSFTTPILVLLTFFASTAHSFTYVGCYGPPTNLNPIGRYIFQSVGYCQMRCQALHQPILAVTNGTDCLCGSAIPQPDSLVEDTLCNSRCVGWWPRLLLRLSHPRTS